MRASNPKRSEAYRFYRYKLRSTKFSAHFEPSRRRNSQKTPKIGPFWAVLASIFSTIARKSSTIVLQRARKPKTVRNLRHGVPMDRPHLSFYRTARRYRLQRPPRPLFGPKMGFLAPQGDQQASGACGSPKSDFSARPYLQNQAATGRTTVL